MLKKDKRNKKMQNKRLILIRLPDYTDFLKVGGPI
jgi:hypothetical protein